MTLVLCYTYKRLHQLISPSTSRLRRLCVFYSKSPVVSVNESRFMNTQRHFSITQYVIMNNSETQNVTLSNSINNNLLKVHNLHHSKGLCTSSCCLNHKTNYKIVQNNQNKHLEITLNNSTLKIPYIWLRDHCRSGKCYNHTTFQKNADLNLLKTDCIPASVHNMGDNRGVVITWKDRHISEFTFEFLMDNFYPGRFCHRTERLPWKKSMFKSYGLPEVLYDHHMSKESGLQQSLTNLVRYGFTFIQEAPISVQGTKTAAERVASVYRTIFGEMWKFTADGARSDTSYSTQYLGAHTDNTYMTSPAGIQVFQCLEHSGTGGETLLVDGLNAAKLLWDIDPTAFHLLSGTAIPHEYIEPPSDTSPGYHLYTLGTVISTHPASAELLQIRYNPYDRAPLNTVKLEAIEPFYDAYNKLSQIIADPSNELWVKLKPGSILLIDNWRVMHGRAAFDGQRIMCGCYLPREEWLSKARTLAVL